MRRLLLEVELAHGGWLVLELVLVRVLVLGPVVELVLELVRELDEAWAQDRRTERRWR